MGCTRGGFWHLIKPGNKASDTNRDGGEDVLQVSLRKPTIPCAACSERTNTLGNRSFNPLALGRAVLFSLRSLRLSRRVEGAPHY
jgi:hypothetical protein